jgi:hypothetical protein
LQSLRFQLHIFFRFSRRCFIALLLAVRSHLRGSKLPSHIEPIDGRPGGDTF